MRPSVCFVFVSFNAANAVIDVSLESSSCRPGMNNNNLGLTDIRNLLIEGALNRISSCTTCEDDDSAEPFLREGGDQGYHISAGIGDCVAFQHSHLFDLDRRTPVRSQGTPSRCCLQLYIS